MVIVDLESYPIDDVEQYLTDPIEAPDNYKKQEAIDAYIARARAAQADKCGLDPDLCRIVALGYSFHDADAIHCRAIITEDDERMALEQFWQNTRNQNYVTFNGSKFDLPVLMRRSLYLGVPYPKLNMDRYRSPHMDLMQILSWNGTTKFHSLRFYCSRFGICVDDVTTGKDVAGMVKAGDWKGVEAHCRADVMATKKLAQRLGVFQHVQEAVGF